MGRGYLGGVAGDRGKHRFFDLGYLVSLLVLSLDAAFMVGGGMFLAAVLIPVSLNICSGGGVVRLAVLGLYTGVFSGFVSLLLVFSAGLAIGKFFNGRFNNFLNLVTRFNYGVYLIAALVALPFFWFTVAPSWLPWTRFRPIYLVLAGVGLTMGLVTALFLRQAVQRFFLRVLDRERRFRGEAGRWRFHILGYLALSAAWFALALFLSPGRAEIGSGSFARPSRSPGRRVVVVGFDGFTCGMVDYLVGKGLMPEVSRLSREGSRFPLAPRPSTPDPAVWTSVATGYGPRKHGVDSYVSLKCIGVGRGLDLLGFPYPGWFVGPALVLFGLAEHVPVSRYDRCSAALWDLVGDSGLGVDVVNWWTSWPAGDLTGRVVTNRAHLFLGSVARINRPDLDGIVHPPSLMDTLMVYYRNSLAELYAEWSDSTRKAETAFWSAIKKVYAVDNFHFRTAEGFLADGSASLTLLYVPGMDIIQRFFRRKSRRVADLDLALLENYGAAVSFYSSRLNRWLERMLAAAGEGTVVVLVFYPGWCDEYCTAGGSAEGLCIVSGPGVRHRRLSEPLPETAVAPLVLALLGLPVGQGMDGKIVTEVLRREPFPGFLVEAGDPAVSRLELCAGPGSSKSDIRFKEWLRAMGYPVGGVAGRSGCGLR